jgi:hypothetical protein
MLQEHILKLPTPRLLAYYKKHYQRDNPHVDNEDHGIYAYDEQKHNDWNASHTAIKAELNKRENVEK